MQTSGAAPTRSPAAGAAGCALAPTEGLKHVRIQAAGPRSATVERTYELYVPKGITVTSSVPLLISLHGTGANGTIQNALTHWSTFDDVEAASGSPFILALPDGLDSLWFWGADNSYDVSFLFSVIADIQATGCVAPSAIYADGWSEGAYMAQRLACDDGAPAAPDRGVSLAAVHAYAGGNPAVGPASCGPRGRPAKNVRILLSQGLDDQLISAERMAFPALTAWGERYGCQPPAAPFAQPQQLNGCRQGTAVAWWPIAGFGHTTWSCAGDELWHNRGVWAFLIAGAAPTSTTCS